MSYFKSITAVFFLTFLEALNGDKGIPNQLKSALFIFSGQNRGDGT